MAFTQRTVFELRCDIMGCTSVISGPNYQTVQSHAMSDLGGWAIVSVQTGHGHTDLIYRCDLHPKPA